MLIDPASEDPMPHIQFRPVVANGKERWQPFARAGSLRGDRTIKVLKLDRDDLIDFYGLHVENEVDPTIDRILKEVASGDGVAARRSWNELALPLLNIRSKPFTALSHDALDHRMPIGVRRAWSLSLRRPR